MRACSRATASPSSRSPALVPRPTSSTSPSTFCGGRAGPAGRSIRKGMASQHLGEIADRDQMGADQGEQGGRQRDVEVEPDVEQVAVALLDEQALVELAALAG